MNMMKERKKNEKRREIGGKNVTDIVKGKN